MKLWAMQTRPLLADEASRLLNALPDTLQKKVRTTEGMLRQQSLWAYSLLRFALRESCQKELPDIVWSSQGKPCFAGRQEPFFNLSHTDGAILVGLSRRELGVDIEKDREAPARLKKILQTDKAFFSEWVRWEACAKCLGDGVLPLLRKGALPENMTYYAFETFPGYWSGAAVRGTEANVEVYIAEQEQLLRMTEMVRED